MTEHICSHIGDTATSSILIVDDNPENLRLLSGILKEQGYEVRLLRNGNMVLPSVLYAPPDLILLDIMMPETDGYEVCRQLKADEKTCKIPVIFISALNDVGDKVKAFSAGGLDYISKPFQSEEVLARVKTHLTISRLQQQLTAQNERLQSEIAEHRKTAAALQEREEKLVNANIFLDQIINAMPNPVFVKDEHHRWLIINDTLCDFMGYGREQLIGKSDYDFFPKEQADVFWEKDDLVFKSETVHTNEESLTDSAGKLCTILTKKSVMTDINGEKILVGIITDITERKKMEDALRESEEKYRDLVQNANNVILRANPQWEITFFNAYAQQFFGYTEEEIIGKTVFETIVPHSESVTGRDLNILLHDIAKYPDKYRYNENENIRKNGERVWLAWTNKVLSDSEGNPKEILCIGNDITEKKQADKALLESEEKYRNLVENLSDAMFMTDTKGNVFYISPIIEAIVGLKPEEIVGRHLSEFFHPEDLPIILKKFQKIISGQDVEPSEVRVFHKSGKTIWIRTSSRVHIRNGVILGLQGLITDITARKHAEEELLRSRTFIQSILNAIQDGILVIDKAFNIVLANPTLEKWASQNSSLIGRKCYEAVRGRSEFCENCPSVSVIETGIPLLNEVKTNDKQGEENFWEVYSFPMKDSAGNLSGAVEHVRNINSRKLAEKKLSSANKAVMDSIRYAELIQKSILPNIDEVKIVMPDSFFIWLPRDIVGGDIFFVHSFDKGFVFAVIDCTGHGIPGAFMSMIAFSALKRIVSDGNCDNPAEILKRMNKIVKTSLRQDTAYTLSDDGLDAAICAVKIKDTCSELTFAGAKMPLYYVRNGEIRIVKGDRRSIGYKRSDLNFDFGNYMIPIEKGTVFYMASDGFTDQLGADNRRFGAARFGELLKKIAHLPFEKQREILLEAFEVHKGTRHRQDDVTVAGFGF